MGVFNDAVMHERDTALCIPVWVCILVCLSAVRGPARVANAPGVACVACGMRPQFGDRICLCAARKLGGVHGAIPRNGSNSSRVVPSALEYRQPVNNYIDRICISHNSNDSTHMLYITDKRFSQCTLNSRLRTYLFVDSMTEEGASKYHRKTVVF